MHTHDKATTARSFTPRLAIGGGYIKNAVHISSKFDAAKIYRP